MREREQRVGLRVVRGAASLRHIERDDLEAAQAAIDAILSDRGELDPVPLGQLQFGHVRLVHEHHHPLTGHAAVAIIVGIDGGVELIVAADGHELEVRRLRHVVILVHHAGHEQEIGLAGWRFPEPIPRGDREVEPAGLVDPRVVILEPGNHGLDLVADVGIVGDELVPVHAAPARHGSLGELGDDPRLGAAEHTRRRQLTGGAVHHREAVLHGDGLLPPRLHVLLGAAKRGEDIGPLAMGEMRPVELRRDIDGQADIRDLCPDPVEIGDRAEEVSAHRQERVDLTAQDRLAAFGGIVSPFAWRREGESGVEPLQEGLGRRLVDAHRAIALHVAVSTDRAGSSPEPADVAAQEQQVHDLLHRVAAASVLGDAHAPAGDHPLRLHVGVRGLLQLRAGECGKPLDRGPIERAHIIGKRLEPMGVLLDEVDIEDASAAGCTCGVIGFDHQLGDRLHRNDVTTGAQLEIVRADRLPPPGQHLDRALRIGELDERALFQRVERQDRNIALGHRMQVTEHARAVRAGVLSDDEQAVARVPILQRDSALADADALRQRHGGGGVAHVGAVGEVVGAHQPPVQLPQKGCFVGRAPRGVEFDALGIERSDRGSDLPDGGCPVDRLIPVRFGIVAQRMGQPALVLQLMVTPALQFLDRMLGEKVGARALCGGLPGDGLGAVLAIFGGMRSLGIGPGAAWTIKASRLVHVQQRAVALDQDLLPRELAFGGVERSPSPCRCLLRGVLACVHHSRFLRVICAGDPSARPIVQRWYPVIYALPATWIIVVDAGMGRGTPTTEDRSTPGGAIFTQSQVGKDLSGGERSSRQQLLARDREGGRCSSCLCQARSGYRLTTPDPEIDLPRRYPAAALRINEAELPILEREANGARVALLEVDSFKALERADRSAVLARMGHVQLNDFVTVHSPGIGYIHRHGHRAIGRDRLVADAGIPVREAGVGETVAERVEDLSVEVAVGAPLHRIVVERGQIVSGLVESDRQASGWAVVSRQEAGDGMAALATRIPGFDDRRDVRVGPVHAQRRSVHQHQHDGLAGGMDALEQLLLRFGQV